MRASFSQRPLRFVFAANLISMVGSGMNSAAVAWYILKATHSEMALGTFAVLQTVPAMLMLPFTGVVIDREDRRRLVMWLDAIRAVIIVTVAMLAFREQVKVWQLYLMNTLVAAGFWIFAALVLAAGAKLMHLDQAQKLDAMRRQLGFLAPNTRLELGVWFLLSSTAGFCEEFIFRGYLQLQFAAMTRSMLAGALLSAVVFGASHGYEGGARMILIGIFGLMFGLLAWWRRSLRPGMIAHAWHDALSGAALRMLK